MTLFFTLRRHTCGLTILTKLRLKLCVEYLWICSPRHVSWLLWLESTSWLDTVPLETMGPFAGGKTLCLPNKVAANSLWWDENRNRGRDEVIESPGELYTAMSW